MNTRKQRERYLELRLRDIIKVGLYGTIVGFQEFQGLGDTSNGSSGRSDFVNEAVKSGLHKLLIWVLKALNKESKFFF